MIKSQLAFNDSKINVYTLIYYGLYIIYIKQYVSTHLKLYF